MSQSNQTPSDRQNTTINHRPVQIQNCPTNLAAVLFGMINVISPFHAERFWVNFTLKNPNWLHGPRPIIDEYVQINEINHYWRMQLGLSSNNTIHARSCIIDNLSTLDWISNYRKYIIPEIIKIPNEEMTLLWRE